MRTRTKSKKILIVDDNQSMANCLAEMVDIFGIPSEIASDGDEAMEMLKSESYFLIIADTNMPKISGFTLLKHIRKNYPNTKVAIMSTMNSDTTQGMVVRDMPDFYLPKPFKTADIEDLLAEL
ncbi:MAG: response regulator [candidate division Zixibacteria bacterium]|nr:response regulator [candidate division Zixibacteria bacterium]